MITVITEMLNQYHADGLTDKKIVRIETLSGIKTLNLRIQPVGEILFHRDKLSFKDRYYFTNFQLVDTEGTIS